MSLYKLQKEQIRNSIIEKTILLFKEKGYDNVSVEEITRKVGIAKGTFYNFFPSKKEILSIWSIKQFQQLKIEELICPDKMIEENLYHLTDTVYQLIREESDMFYYFLKEMIYSGLSELNDNNFDFAAILKAVIMNSKDHLSIDVTNIDIEVNIINSALFYEILKWFQADRPLNELGHHLKEIVKFCLYGLYHKGGNI